MTERETRRRRRRRASISTVGLALLLTACGPDNSQNTLRPAGRSAQKILDLFTWPFWVGVVIGVLVIGATIFAAIRFRARPGNENPRQIHGSTPLEIGWTIVPLLILVVLAVPTVATIWDLAKEPKGDVLNIRVVGKQWWWEFQYPKQKIVTADEFHIPAGRKVRLQLTACDPSLGSGPGLCNVIHSFWIPALAGKQDVVPGRTQWLAIQAFRDQAGKTFLGQCAEYCGLSHARMRLRVHVDSPIVFDDWVASQQQSPPALADSESRGAKLLGTYGCVTCHSVDDPSKDSYGPNLAHLASRENFASDAYVLNKENLVNWILDAPSMVPMETKGCPRAQKPGCVGMPSFTKNLAPGDKPMPKADAEAIADYLLKQR
ncbi:MAG: cytochrome c oxidase subunit II [Acidimicrobiia bacterium]